MKDRIDVDRLHAYLAGTLSEREASEVRKAIASGAGKQTWYDVLAEMYLADQLDDKWQAEVKLLMDRDAQFRSTLQFHQVNMTALRQAGDVALKQELKQLIPKTNRAKRSIRRSMTLWISAAAAIILVMIVFGSGILDRSANAAELYTEYYAPYDMLLSARSGEGGDLQKEAISAYQSGNFQVAKENFAKLDSSSDEPLFALYSAISMIESGELDDAHIVLGTLRNDPALGEHAQWYLALLHLKADDTGAAREILRELESSSGYYRDEAVEIIERLDGR